MHGRGKLVWPDGVVYEGDFRDGTISGEGKYMWTDGSTYEGGVKFGLRHGEGKFICGPLAATYSGGWVEGKREGKV